MRTGRTNADFEEIKHADCHLLLLLIKVRLARRQR
jgi:hypothetical protein